MSLFVQVHTHAGDYLIDSWDSEKVLSDNSVTSIVQTPDGYLWIGTYNGLARFDGSRFVTFDPGTTPEIGHARIHKVLVDAEGTLWINTFDGSLTSFRRGVFTMEWRGKGNDSSEAWLVSSNSREIVFAFRSGLLLRRSLVAGGPKEWRVLEPPGAPPGAWYCEDYNGVLWCSTLNGKLWRIVNDRFELLPGRTGLRGQEIHWLAPDLSRRIWVGTEKEIAVWDGKHFQDMTPDGEKDLNVASLFFARNGEILVDANGRLRKYLDRRWTSEMQAWPDLTQERQMWPVLYEDREGDFWQISRGMGTTHVGPDNTSQQIAIAQGLPGDHVSSWFEDREGNIWVGLGRGGISRLRKKKFEVLGMPDGVSVRPAVSVCEDKFGVLWIGTYGGGLNQWQNGVLTNFRIPTPTSPDFVYSIYPDSSGQLWISAGLEDIFNFRNGQLRSAPTAAHGVKSILIDQHGRTWMGKYRGVACWAESTLKVWDSLNGSTGKPVRALAEDARGAIWIGSDDGNLYQFKEDAFKAYHLPGALPNEGIWSLLPDVDGSLWIGSSNGGLLHLEESHFTRFTSADGLPDDVICQILDDQRGNLWIGSHHGIFRVNKGSLRAFASKETSIISCSVFGRADGLPTLQCSEMYQPSAWRAHDGKLWFATAKGVVGVQPDAVPINDRAPPVVIEEFLVNGKIQSLPSGRNASAAPLNVSPNEQNLEIRYTALSLTDADKIHFRYKLEGFDSAWVNAGTRRWVQYSYLKAGMYRFHVIACNNDGLWNVTGASTAFRILPPVWETWWFRIVLAFVLVAGVAGTSSYIIHRRLRGEMERLERQRVIEQDRARIARDIHDHIGSGLTHINLLSALLLGDPAGLIQSRVKQITNVTCELIGAVDEIVWAVDPKNDTLDSLMIYLSDFADEYLRMAEIRLHLAVPTQLPAWNLTSEVRHNLFLSVKEVLNNIVKHAEAKEVVFSLRVDPGAATLEIRDDGCGFQLDSVSVNTPFNRSRAHGNGLGNFHKRAFAIGGLCVIKSAPGKGTEIQFTIPAPTNA